MRRIVKILVSILSGIALLLLLGWGVYNLGRIYLDVISNSKALIEVAPQENPGDRQTLRLAKFEIFTLQYGMFEDVAKANQLVKELEKKGLAPVVIEGQPNRVVANYFGKLDAAKAEKTSLKGLAPVEKVVAVNGLTFRMLPGEGEQAGVILSNYAKILSQSVAVFVSADFNKLKNQDLTGLINEVEKLRNETTQAMQLLSKSDNKNLDKEGIERLNEQGLAAINSLHVLIKNKNRKNYLESQKNFLKLTTIYRQFIDNLQKTTS